MAGDMRSALERYTKEELIDLMTHLVRVYVLEATPPLAPETERPRATEELAALTFPQLLLHLQMRLDHEELGRFRVSGDDVYVTLGAQEFHIDESPAPAAPTPASEADAASAAAEVPSSPVTGEPDFDLDDTDRAASRRSTPAAPGVTLRASPSPSRTSRRPRPEPIVRQAPAPPPIMEVAPGDPSRAELPPPPEPNPVPASANSSREGRSEERPMRIEREPLPPLADGDKEIEPSNRFADLELD